MRRRIVGAGLAAVAVVALTGVVEGAVSPTPVSAAARALPPGPLYGVTVDDEVDREDLRPGWRADSDPPHSAPSDQIDALARRELCQAVHVIRLLNVSTQILRCPPCT